VPTPDGNKKRWYGIRLYRDRLGTGCSDTMILTTILVQSPLGKFFEEAYMQLKEERRHVAPQMWTA
jgi:hypothetical protein